MYILGTSDTRILEALGVANEKFNNNLQWDIFPAPLGGYNVSLHVIDKTGPGHRLTHPAIHGGRPVEIHTACWHVYYAVFIALPGDAEIQKDRRRYKVVDQKYPVWTEDRGSRPILITELCECLHPKRFPNPYRGERWQDLYTPVPSTRQRLERAEQYDRYW